MVKSAAAVILAGERSAAQVLRAKPLSAEIKVKKNFRAAEGVRKNSRFTQVPYWLYIGSTWRRYFGKKCRRCDFGGFGR